MDRLHTINGTYGRGTETAIHCVETRNGTWYAVDGSQNVNFTRQAVPEGIDVETLIDDDYFHASGPIEDPEDIERELEE